MKLCQLGKGVVLFVDGKISKKKDFLQEKCLAASETPCILLQMLIKQPQVVVDYAMRHSGYSCKICNHLTIAESKSIVQSQHQNTQVFPQIVFFKKVQ